MEKPFFSIIIPTYNSADTLVKLLKSISVSSFKDFEVIVVDDFSNDETSKLVKKFPVKYYRLKKRSGPSITRNMGVKLAKGKALFFIDSDIIIYKDTLKKMFNMFTRNPRVKAAIGYYSSEPANAGFIAKFKALRDYAYWNIDRKFKTVDSFGGSAAINKQIFKKIGGFDPKFREMEDYEIGARIIKICPIYYSSKILFKHHFPSFWTLIKNYFKRALSISEIIQKRKKFFYAGATFQEGAIVIFVGLATSFLILSFFKFFFFWFFTFFLLLRIIFGRKFIIFTFQKEGFIFVIKAFFFSWLLYLVVFAAGITKIFIIIWRFLIKSQTN